MKKFVLCMVLILAMTMVVGCKEENRVSTDENVDVNYEELFGDYNGCFIMMDDDLNYTEYNKELLEEAIAPCSSFKVLNSLIGLETGVVHCKDTMYPYDGTVHSIEQWNRDHTLETAIANSVVWYYQALARDVGEQQMQKYIDLVGYGNRDISGGIDKFWLESSLKVTPKDQVDFLYNMFNYKYDFFAKENVDIVKDIIIQYEDEDVTLYGKTGSGDGGSIGWFIGVITRGDTTHYFATNIRGGYGSVAKEITMKILEASDLLEMD